MNRSTAHSDSSRRLKERLRHELKWLRLRLAGHAALMLLGGIGLLLGVGVMTVAGWTRLGEPAAWVLLGVIALSAVWIVVFELVRPLRRLANLKGFSRALEEHGDYGNLLEAATQFSSHKREDPLQRGASPELVREILRRASEMAEASRLAPRIPLVGVSNHLGVAALALIVWIVVGVAMPDQVTWTRGVLMHPSALREVVATGGLYAVSEDQRVAVGADIELVAHDFIDGDDSVVLEVNRIGDFWRAQDTRLEAISEDPAPYRRAVATLERIEDPFRYRFRKNDAVSAVHRVEVRERPVITELRMRLIPPGYVGRGERELENPGGSVSVLVGTRIEMEGRASSQLIAARRLGQKSIDSMKVEGDRFSDALTIDADTEFRIELVDTHQLESEALTVYRIVAQLDEAPSVRITAPARDLPLERDLMLRVAAIAADDVGLAHVELIYRNELETEWRRVALFVADGGTATDDDILDLEIDRGSLDVAINFEWDLGALDLIPGDAVAYALEATDNNALEGGQVTRSRTWRLRLPTIAEVFDLDREERSADNHEFKELLSEGNEIQQDLERLNRELKKNPNPDWDKQQEIRETLERQQEFRDKLKEQKEELQQQIDEFARNNEGSPELLEKMEVIEDLLESLQDDESLQAYLEAMRDAMDQLLPHEIQRNMEDTLANQEEMNRRLDRTIELLKQLEMEREMSDLVEEVNEYLRRQDQLAELTDPEGEQEDGEPQGEESPDGEPPEGEQQDGEQQDREPSEGDSEDSETQDGETPPAEDSPPRQLDDEDLARMQEQLREETEKLEERLREALEKREQEQQDGESPTPSSEEMKKALEEALEQLENEGKPSDPMEEAENKLGDGEREEAHDKQEEARKRLLSLYEVLMQGQQMMQQAQGKYAGEKLQQTAFDLLQLSHREEGVIDALANGVRGQRTRSLTREQARVVRALDALSSSLEELARQDFNVPERLLSAMRELVEMSGDAVDELQRGRTRRSRETSRESMGKMNEIVIGLLTAAKNSQGSGGGAEPSASQQMREMAESQGRLNGMTEELRKKMQDGGLSAGERRQLAEMKGRQEAIRRQLEKMREQIEDERRLLGDLEDLGRSMERVEDDLGGGQLSEDTQRQQEKILSRLLDAQRSIRERDFAKRRESRGADDLFRTQIGRDDLPGADQREDALRRYIAPERAPEAYRDEVRRYFRSIQRELERSEGGSR